MRTLHILAAAVLGVLLFAVSAFAQPTPGSFAQRYAVAGNPVQVTASGAQAAVRGLNVSKTYQLTAQTSAGTGSVAVTVEGSMDSVTWDTIGTITLSLTTSPASGSFTSLDRYMFVRANAGTLTGTGAAYTLWMGF